VQLQVQKDAVAACPEGFDKAVAGSIVELHAYLQPNACVTQTVYKVERPPSIRNIERYGQMFASVTGDACL
jgi:hypothetical protein